MTEITVIRHGQAQTGAKDAASYDRLSDLGHRQARWLGEHFKRSLAFDHVVSGTLNRQIETAQSLGLAGVPHHQDCRLNELDYFGLARSLESSHGVPFPQETAAFAEHVPLLLDLWRQGRVDPSLESYEAFRARTAAALWDAARLDGQVLLVTSGGVIATLAALALELDSTMKSKLFLHVAHTSVHKFALHGDELHLTQFGGTPHLDRPDRAHAKTHA